MWFYLAARWLGIWHVSGPWGGPYHSAAGPEKTGHGSGGKIWSGQKTQTSYCRPSKGY